MKKRQAIWSGYLGLFALLAVLFLAAGCQWAGWEVDWERQTEDLSVARFNWQIQGVRDREFRYEIECNFGIEKVDNLTQGQPVFETRAKECLLLGADVYNTAGQKAELNLDSEGQELKIIRQGEQYRVEVDYGLLQSADGSQLDFCDPDMDSVPPILIPSVLMDLGAEFDEPYDFSLSDYQGCATIEMKVLLDMSPVASAD